MREGGKVVATESSGEDAERGRRYLSGLVLSEVVDYRVGEAILIASHLEGPFDIVFNDIDKQDYPRSLKVTHRLLRPGGLFISDNMLWYGRVLQRIGDEATQGVKELTKALLASKNYLTTLIPLRDGVTVSLKLS